MKAPRDEIGNALIALKEKGYPVVVIDSDLASSTRTDQFQAIYPEAFFEMGIAEGSAMSFAVGQALEGFMPFYVNFAMFVTGTAWTQLRQACYAKANIKLVGSHPGMDDGPDGASHHALEDLALTRVLPGLTVLTPADAEEIAEPTRQAEISYAVFCLKKKKYRDALSSIIIVSHENVRFIVRYIFHPGGV